MPRRVRWTHPTHRESALRSQFDTSAGGEANFLDLNALPPSQHELRGFVPADVMIYDTLRPAHFPNGRALEDDVVTIADRFTSFPTDHVAAELEVSFCSSPSPCPDIGPYPSATATDVRIQAEFPYLGAPY